MLLDTFFVNKSVSNLVFSNKAIRIKINNIVLINGWKKMA